MNVRGSVGDWRIQEAAATMHVLFVHENYPAQFGHVARWLAERQGWRCTFVTQRAGEAPPGIERIAYHVSGGATPQTNYCSRTFENQIWRSQAVFDVLAARPDIQPDLIVGHSGFVSTLFLRELYACPVVNYFEYFYRTRNSDLDFRNDLPLCPPRDLLRARARNAMLLLDLENCDAGYSPTCWQRSRLPERYQQKITTIFDGIDTSLWRPRAGVPRRIAGWDLPGDKRIVTYVSRGMESMRGFDIVMRVASHLTRTRDDVLFVIVGEDRVVYGGDRRFTGNKTFKQWVLEREPCDLSRVLFVGRIPPRELAQLFSLSDLHLYLTVPFVLSWSLMDALACGCTILASDTAPVREMIRHEENGLLVDFFDVDGFVAAANRVLDDPAAFRQLGRTGVQLIEEQYSLETCMPRMRAFFQEVSAAGGRVD